MKLRPSIIYVIILLTLSSSECNDKRISFRHPQPVDTRDRTEFDANIQGTYLLVDRNFPPKKDFLLFDYLEIKEFLDTLSAVLNLPIDLTDSTKLALTNNQMFRSEKGTLLLNKESFSDYIKNIWRIDKLRFIKSLTSTELFREFIDSDTIILQDQILYFFDDSVSTECHFSTNAIDLVIDQDTIGSILFTEDAIIVSYAYDNVTLDVYISDSTILAHSIDTMRKNPEEQESSLEFNYSDTTLQISNDKEELVNIYFSEELMHVILDTDTLEFQVHDNTIHWNLFSNLDTLFTISSVNILRKYRNSYYLSRNTCGEDTIYCVSQLSLKNNIVSLAHSNLEADLQILKELTEVTKVANDHYHVNPSKKEFKKFIKSDGFHNRDLYQLMLLKLE